MSKLSLYFMSPGADYASFLVGACSAIDAPRERQRWFGRYMRALSDGPGAEREAAEGVYAASVLASRVGHRIAKRWIVRLSRTTRIHYEKRYRDMFPRRRR